MNWNDHSKLKGTHPLFSPSQPAFFQLSGEDFKDRLIRKSRTGLGTEFHEWAALKITRRHKITNVREELKSIDEYIYSKYYNEKFGYLPIDAVRLLKALPYVPKEVFTTIKDYVNDAIGFGLDPEVVLYYSEDFYGTTDAIGLEKKVLRIHDLKTGSTPAKMEQLFGYDALYCLEYKVDPMSIEHELRIYQNDDILIANPTGEDIKPYMDKFIEFDRIQREFERGA